MEGIFSWATAVTVCSVIACIVEILTGNSSLDKTVRFVLGIFMLCVIITPLINTAAQIVNTDITAEYEYNESNDEKKEAQIKILKSRLQKLVEKTLAENDIEPLVTLITISIADDSSIESIKAAITLQNTDAEKAADTEELIRSRLGIECSISVS